MNTLRNDFPIFKTDLYKAYLDNAASTHKPYAFISAIHDFYAYQYAPVHRSSYAAAERATTCYEQARAKTALFLGAQSSEIVFSSGATQAINLIAYGWALHNVCSGDEILITALEHHANILVWQMVCAKNNAKLIVAPLQADGGFCTTTLINLINIKTKLVAIIHMSHVLGIVIDAALVSAAAHSVGAAVLLDAAQSAPQGMINVTELGIDFLVFSAHKMMGPTGLGILYIAQRIVEQMQLCSYGGGMVYQADYQHATWLAAPHCFEAGTQAVAQVIGWSAVLDYCKDWDWKTLRHYQNSLIVESYNQLSLLSDVHILGKQSDIVNNSSIISFTLKKRHVHDVAAFLDSKGCAVRAGDHCAQPLMKNLAIQGSIRLSVFCYTSMQEIQWVMQSLEQALANRLWIGF